MHRYRYNKLLARSAGVLIMAVEEDSIGFSNLEVGNKHAGLVRGVILMCISSSYVHV